MNDSNEEMVAGCCVCSDESGWAENPLVYCDGAGCNIAVHQACYGIKSVPDGNWYCRKCESQERSARVRCELCPSKDGALKRTDNGGWAHVVCGLYIPEVRFGDVAIMEPIVLSQIPTERYNKVCYICEQNNRGSRASLGACMQCNKAGCKQQFHVTCAQAMGLLCEEAGNYSDNVKYCGYCQEHFMKLKKGANVKTIPPYRPMSYSSTSGSEETPEKKPPLGSQTAADLKQGPKRKSVSSRPSSQNGSIKSTNADRKESLSPSSSIDHLNGSIVTTCTTASTVVVSPSQINKNDSNSRFTTSNFIESVITPSESVFADVQKNKKRKLSEQPSPVNISNVEPDRPASRSSANIETEHNEDEDGDDAPLKFVEEPNLSAVKTEPTMPITSFSLTSSSSSTNVSTVISSSTLAIPSTSSVPVVAPTISTNANHNSASSNPVSSSYLSSTSYPDAKMNKSDTPVEKNRNKPKRSAGGGSGVNRKSKNNERDSPIVNGPAVAETALPSFASSNVPTTSSASPNVSYSSASSTSAFFAAGKNDVTAAPTISPANLKKEKESPPNSPVDHDASVKSNKDDRSEKETKLFQSGSSAPHMLGNQLNPTSSMAQKMSETLNDELEAHSIFTTADSNANGGNFVGPPLFNKILSSSRPAESSKRPSSMTSLSGSTANFPRSLEELLETQWEQSGAFLMEQAHHFDIASLLTCLHKLQEENLNLQENIRSLKERRDHLLAVNARLAMPLAPISQHVTVANNAHTQPQTQQQQHAPPVTQPSHHPPIAHVAQQQTPQTMSNLSHAQQYQAMNQSGQMASMSEANARNISLQSNVYTSTPNTLGGQHRSVYPNPHTMENGLAPTPGHHQHSRGISAPSNAGALRHHSSTSGAGLYGSSQPSQNPGVVVRSSTNDRRNASVVSSNYQQPYQMSSMHQQQQMTMHRDDPYHSVLSKPN